MNGVNGHYSICELHLSAKPKKWKNLPVRVESYKVPVYGLTNCCSKFTFYRNTHFILEHAEKTEIQESRLN